MKTINLQCVLGAFGGQCRALVEHVGLVVLLLWLQAFGAWAQPSPVVRFSFSEGWGTVTTNEGSRGGEASFAQQGGYPVFSPVVPLGPYAPALNGGAVDFGMITSSTDGNRAVDLPGALGPMSGFTVCGWVNCRSLTVGWGGNRLVFALVAPNSSGFDLVHLANGSLQLGVNQWPDGSPAVSSAGRITADENTGTGNWVFFAVTYDGTQTADNVKFYFGNGDTPAALDVTRTYSRGVLPDTGAVTLGNFGPVAGARTELGPGGGSRVLRGLLDQVMVFTNVLSLEEIQAAQVAAASPPAPLAFISEPVDRVVNAGQDAVFTVAVRGGLPIWYQWQRDGVDIPGATNATYVLSPARPQDHAARFRVVVSNLVSMLVSSNATLGVQSDFTPPWVVEVKAPSLTNILVSFSEPVDAGTAQEVGNYALEPGNLGIWSAVLAANQTNVLLTTEPMVTGAVYTLRVVLIGDRALPVPNFLLETNIEFRAYMPPPLRPVVELAFSEGTGTTATNLGTRGGVATFAQQGGYPVFSPVVPTGPYAPAFNIGAVDFGMISSSTDGNRAVDLPGALGPMSGFTVCGWVNCRSLTIGGGGNRLVFALVAPNSSGFDLVHLANGSLQLGVNQWPDGSPAVSSAGRITADANTGVSNWVFFAVTYDGTQTADNVKYYFGNGGTPAALDVTRTYNRGVLPNSGAVTLGNFGSVVSARTQLGPGGGSRVLRGLLDQVMVFTNVLSLEEIQRFQARAAGVASTSPPGLVAQPASVTVFAGQPAAFSVMATGTPPLSVQWLRNGDAIPGATNFVYSFVASLADAGATWRAVVSNLYGTVMSDTAMLTVLPENGWKVRLPLNEGAGTVTTNLGNLGGTGAFIQQGGFPVFSTNVPMGFYAPASNLFAVDFGVLGASDGNRAIDLTNPYGNTLGRMEAFTVCGWLNCRDLTAGGGGNRLLFALDGPGGRGFDLVQLSNGALQLGVNQWPDGSPAISSAGRVTADPAVGPQNWVFFGVTYDPGQASGHVKFYFGSPVVPAAVDRVVDYPRGVLAGTGALTLGNFGIAGGSARTAIGPSASRCFRGLLDEVQVFNRALTLTQLQLVQVGLAPDVVVAPPYLSLGRDSNQLMIRWSAPVPFRLFFTDDLRGGNWQPVEAAVEAQDGQSTVRLQADQPQRFFRLQP
ncbi:MAG: hypothetical protein N3J91_16030 [Verrucomicrobiae bacterium]|nr:hypothetical protein [Verrucomicrobiae bacterium]